MNKFLLINLLAAASLAAAGSVQAGYIFKATLTHDQEVPLGSVPDEGSSGIATFGLNGAKTRLTYDVQLVGLDLRGITPAGVPLQPIPGDLNANDNVTRMHIHRNIAGANGSIVFGMIDANALLRNDNNPNDLAIDISNLHITGAWDLPEGNLTNLGLELDELFANGLYLNFHTSDHAPGEIRGQILFAVPEPGSLALLGIGALGLMGPALRRRRP